MECKIEFYSFGLKYKECFNKSLTVVFEIEIAFVWITFNDLCRPTIIQLLQTYRVPKKFKEQLFQINNKVKESIQF